MYPHLPSFKTMRRDQLFFRFISSFPVTRSPRWMARLEISLYIFIMITPRSPGRHISWRRLSIRRMSACGLRSVSTERMEKLMKILLIVRQKSKLILRETRLHCETFICRFDHLNIIWICGLNTSRQSWVSYIIIKYIYPSKCYVFATWYILAGRKNLEAIQTARQNQSKRELLERFSSCQSVQYLDIVKLIWLRWYSTISRWYLWPISLTLY